MYHMTASYLHDVENLQGQHWYIMCALVVRSTQNCNNNNKQTLSKEDSAIFSRTALWTM